MPSSTDVQAITSVIAVLVTIIGFVFVGRQLALLRRDLVSDTNGRLSEQSLSILAFLGDRPALYPYFYEGKQLDEGSADAYLVLCVCEMIANYADLATSSLPDLDQPNRSQWTSFIKDTASSSPEWRRFVIEHETWYSRDLVDLIQTSGT